MFPRANNFLGADERLIPNAPVNISVNEEFDTRIGFFGHVILNVSWDGPSSMTIFSYPGKLV